MSHDVIETEVIETEAGIFRIEIRPDEHAESPRGTMSNLGVMVIDEDFCTIDDTVRSTDVWPRSRQTVRDGMDKVNREVYGALYRVREEDISIAAACRYLRLTFGAWAVLPIFACDHRYDVSVSAGDPDDRDTGALSGFILDTPTTREEMGPETPEQAAQWLREEVALLNRWTQGEYVWYSIARLHDPDQDTDVDDVEDDPDAYAWELVDDLHGMEALDYALTEARDTVNAYEVSDFPSPALAAQV